LEYFLESLLPPLYPAGIIPFDNSFWHNQKVETSCGVTVNRCSKSSKDAQKVLKTFLVTILTSKFPIGQISKEVAENQGLIEN